MWIIRAGQHSLYYEKDMMDSKVYLPWHGYCLDLSKARSRTEFRDIVKQEKKIDNRTTVSNWAGQLYSFTQEIKLGDYVLIPSRGSHTYCLAIITGEYCFDKDEKDKLYHSRDIEIIENDIPKDIFSQSVIYSLGAFRTLFKAKHEEEIMCTIEKWKEERR